MEAAARAENAVIAHALEAGYLTSDQLVEARRVVDRRHPGGRPTGALLALLRSDYLEPGTEHDLMRVYRRAMENGDSLESTIQIDVPEISDDASDDPEAGRSRPQPDTKELPAAEDPEDMRTTRDYDDGPPRLGSAAFNAPTPTPPPAHFSGTASWRSSTGRGPLGRDQAASDTWNEEDVIAVGPYRIQGELARGGMGIVYRARHVDLPRDVAIKMLLAGDSATPAQLERFNTEARAASRLRHPNLVAIHDVGIQGGYPFVVMDYIPGETLHERVRRDGPLPVREAARIALAIAHALEYAHSQSVLHRDVTPLNIILTPEGEPLLTDFGLAKELDAVGGGVTQTGQFVGTPAYTPPEQAAGRLDEVDHRCDVYGLGGTLYTCLTGEPPFDAETPLEVLAQITEGTPRNVRDHRPEVEPDLEAICLKCLAKSPDRRYATMRAVADDLSRYLADAPIAARADRPLQRIEAWIAERPRAVAGACIGLLLLAVLLGAANRSLTTDLEQARADLATDPRAPPATTPRPAPTPAASPDPTPYPSPEPRPDRRIAEALLGQAFAALQAGDREASALAFARAAEVARDEPQRRAARLGAAEAIAQGSLRALLRVPAGIALDVRFAPTGGRLICATSERAVVEWGLATPTAAKPYRGHAQAVNSIALSPTGQFLLTGSTDKTVRLWNRETRTTTRVLRGFRSGVIQVAFVRGRGSAAVTIGKRVAVYDLVSGQQLTQVADHPNPVRAFDISRNQRLLVTACADTRARVFDLQTARPIQTIQSRFKILAARFRADGREVVTIGERGNLAVWATVGGKPLAALPPPAQTDPTIALSLSPDEGLAAVGTRSGRVRLIALPSLRVLREVEAREGPAVETAFSPDGRTLAVAAGSHVEVHDLSAILPEARGFTGAPRIRYAGGSSLAWISPPGVHLYDPVSKRKQELAAGGPVIAFDVSSDGGRVAIAAQTTGVVVYDRRTEQVIDRVKALALSLAFSPDGRWLAITSAESERGPEVRLRDVTAQRDLERAPAAHRFPISACTFSSDGRFLFTGDLSGEGRVWAVAAGALKPETTIRRADAPSGALRTRAAIHSAAFDPKAAQVITGHQDGVVAFWSAADGGELARLRAHTDRVIQVTRAPRSAVLVTASHDHTAKLWHLPSRRLLRRIQLDARVIGCDVSPDGDTLVTGSVDRKTLFWDISRPAVPGFTADPVAAVRRALRRPDPRGPK